MNEMQQVVDSEETNNVQESESNGPKKQFSFDRNFQEKIVQVLFHDKAWASQVQEILDPSFFEYAYLQVITQIYFDYNNKYREYPSVELLSTLVAESFKMKKIKTDQLLITQIRTFLPRLLTPSNVGDFAFVKDKTTDFCKRVVLQQALEASVVNIQRGDYDGVSETIRKALAKGITNTKGLDVSNPNDIDARYNGIFRKTIPTGLDQLDKREILNGGLGKGEIGFVVAMSGVGKSHLLTHFGAEALIRGYNVLHYTFELNEGAIAIRYDSNLIGVDSSFCFEHKESIKEMYESNKDTYGRLIIKHYPINQANVNVLRGHIEKLKADNFYPDLILVDYAGIMRSTEKSDLLRIELKKVTEELRALAGEVDVPLWTALQANKEAAGSDIVDMTNMAESFAQAAAADFILGLARKSEQKSTGIGTLFIAKNRAGRDGLKFNIHLDTAQSKLRFLNESEVQERGYTPKAGRDAWKRIQESMSQDSMKLEKL